MKLFEDANTKKEDDVAPIANVFKSEQKAIVFDLGGGTFDITLLNIKKNHEGQLVFEVELTNGDIHLGGSDFDNKLIDYCIKQFCKDTENDEKEVRKDKKACHRLKIKCENAKKLLSTKNEIIINVDNFYKEEDLCIKLSLDLFETICKDLFERINNLVKEVLDDFGKNASDIDNIILVGGATRMVGVKDLLHRIFGEGKVKDNLDPDEAVAFGATMEAAKMEEKDKINFILQDITAYKLGIATENKDPNDKKENGEKMYSIIKKYSKIPSSSEKTFEVELNQNYPNVIL